MCQTRLTQYTAVSSKLRQSLLAGIYVAALLVGQTACQPVALRGDLQGAVDTRIAYPLPTPLILNSQLVVLLVARHGAVGTLLAYLHPTP